MPNPKRLLDALYGGAKAAKAAKDGGSVHMQDGGSPLDRFTGRAPKRGVSSLPGYGEGIDDPTTQALLAIRRNLGEAGRAAVGAKPYDETNPTETYRAMQALFNAPTPAAIIPEAAQAAGKAAGVLSGLGALGVVKPKGGNWLTGAERGVKDFAALKPVGPSHRDEALILGGPWARDVDTPQVQSLMKHNAAISDWIDTKLSKYVRNEMATPEDPVRALAERGITLQGVRPAQQSNILAYERELAGYPKEGMARTPEGKAYEEAADRLIKREEAGSLLDETQYGPAVEDLKRLHPWLEKIDPQTPVYSLSSLYSDRFENTGFRHLVDELFNATNPESGLPRSLQIAPDKLQKVTVPQAVELVDKINKWRAEQKVAADLKRSQNAATVEYKAYDTIPGTTEPNQRGLRWVELRTPEITSADQLTPEAQARYKSYLSTGVGEEAALRQAAKHDESLAESLKYEGEVMGHCVGGYCPDVESGRSRIYSLRDKKGEPHVTIEVQHGEMRGGQSVEDYLNQSPQIVQIKGKANRAPKDEYLPFVQDFVRSSQWSSVGDLGNTGLIRKSDYIDTFTPEMLDSVGVGEYMTKEEFNQLADKLGGINKMAAGGAVSTQNNRKVRISDNPDTMRLELLRKKHA